MKKTISAALVLILLFTTAACANSAVTNTQEPAQTDAAQAESGEAEAENPNADTLSVWCWDPAFNIYAMQEAEKIYAADNPNFKLDIIETPWDDLQTKLTTAATSGQLNTLPDIFLCQNNAFQKNVKNYPEIFLDLTGSLPFTEYAPSVVAYSTVDGKNFGVPFDNGAAVFALRTDVLEQAGYTLADFTSITWDDFITKSTDVLTKTGKPLLSGQAGAADFIMMALQSAGASLFDAQGNPTIVNNDVLKASIALYADLVKKGLLIEVNNWDEYISTFTNGSVAGTINGCWILGSIQTAADQSGKWDITDVPRFANISGSTNYTANGGSSWAVSSNCKNPQLAEDFLAKTFGGSVKFYETILSSSGAISNWLPAAESPIYKEPQPFFSNDAIYAKIIDYAGKVPSNNTGVYYYEARDAVGSALTKVITGASVDDAAVNTALQEAEDTVKFAMGQ